MSTTGSERSRSRSGRESGVPGHAAPGGLSLLVDTHVHLHACFDPARFVEHAGRNLEAAAGDEPGSALALVWTEVEGGESFAKWWAEAPVRVGAWEVVRTEEESSLVARTGQLHFAIIAGQQIRCRDRLEVLALGTRRTFRAGQGIGETVAGVLATGAAAVVPWGLGKWWFGRGRKVEGLLKHRPEGAFFLGDNGGRPSLAPRPKLFARAAQAGVPVLAGSDPLPISAEVSRPGSYGSILQGAWEPARPAQSLRTALEALGSTPPVFGRRVGMGGFVAAQVGIRAGGVA